MILFFRKLFLVTLIFSCFFVNAQKTVAIVGGGIAGIASAHYISKYDSSAKVIVFEKEIVLGGNAKTVEVLNKQNKLVKVDVGPQYFVEGPWDDYIKFLKETLGDNSYTFESMTGTLLIQTQGKAKPHLVTPLGMKLRGEHLSNLTKFKKFNEEAYEVFLHPEKWEGVSIETWYNQLQLSDTYKETIIYPFLAASLGTSVSDIKTTSVLDIVKLFAFRKPKASNKFHIMTDGMGTLIQRIGEGLKNNGVEIRTGAPVYEITKSGKQWLVSYKKDSVSYKEIVDFVVITAHANQSAKILSNESIFSDIVNTLSQLKYFEAKIVLHNSELFVNTSKPAFLNIITTNQNEILASTMNLGMISQRLGGIYKSWLTDADIDKLKATGNFLHFSKFYHPLITANFVSNLSTLNLQTKKINNLYIGGGWSEGLETQNSAVISGKHALEKYEKYLMEK